jgi:DNA-binding transcriptional ArsR family regulator
VSTPSQTGLIATVPLTTVPLTFGALGDPVRCALVEHLGKRGELTVGELAALFPITLQGVSKHIKVLEQAGVVSQRRDGRHRPVALQPQALLLAGSWLEVRRRELDARFERLDDLLAELQSQGGR